MHRKDSADLNKSNSNSGKLSRTNSNSSKSGSNSPRLNVSTLQIISGLANNDTCSFVLGRENSDKVEVIGSDKDMIVIRTNSRSKLDDVFNQSNNTGNNTNSTNNTNNNTINSNSTKVIKQKGKSREITSMMDLQRDLKIQQAKEKVDAIEKLPNDDFWDGWDWSEPKEEKKKSKLNIKADELNLKEDEWDSLDESLNRLSLSDQSEKIRKSKSEPRESKKPTSSTHIKLSISAKKPTPKESTPDPINEKVQNCSFK